MRIEPDTVKGFQDFLPPDSLKRQKVRKIVEKVFRLYGFQPMETPTVEYDELMRQDDLADDEDEAVSDRFRLRDKGGRKLGLRYELTFQLSRVFKQNPNIKLPFRRYQIGSAFRDEPTSASRFREFTQCDIDIVGDPSVEADAECIAVFSDIMKELKIKAKAVVNNRKLLQAIIESVKIPSALKVMRELDKLAKVGEDRVKANLRKFASPNQIITLFKLLEKPLDFFVKNLFDGAEELKKLSELCRYYGVRIEFDPVLARGLAYYTGNIFEFKVPGSDSIAAGGRYDGVVGKFMTKPVSAIGISAGLERLTALADVKTQRTEVAVISLAQDKEAIRIAKALRKNKRPCLLFFGKPGKWLDYADSQGVKHVIFVGLNEVAQKKYKLKDMASGQEKLLTEKQLLNKLGKK